MDANYPFDWYFVDTPASLNDALEDLSRFTEVAFDTGGVNLSRTGPLTVLTLLGIDAEEDDDDEACTAVAYVIDVLALGGQSAFDSGLGELLENCKVCKVMFDCRTDSDALFHQFNVHLNNVLDCQVFEQAARLADGDPLPKRTTGDRPVPFLQGMAAAAHRYLSPTLLQIFHAGKKNPQHKSANDVHVRR